MMIDNLPEWLNYLENRYQEEIQLGLDNVGRVATLLQIATWTIPIITVAGTNGKGSTVAAISAIYQAAGYRVGQFTSPHLLQFNERICINSHPISDEMLCQLFVIIERARGDIQVSFFEMSFLAALLYFKESNLDILILEVGLGGRLDATNILSADVAVITTIDLDHQAFLGKNKEAIGKEKAGIMRAGQSCIYADISPPQSILSHAKALGTSLYCLGRDFHYQLTDSCLHIKAWQEDIVLPTPTLHVQAAVAGVIASLCLAKQLPISIDAWMIAMQQVRIIGRQHLIQGNISFLYDVAHNPQAARALAARVQQTPVSGTVHAVFSALKDKDICGLIKPLSTIVGQWYPACLQGKRAASAPQLLTALAECSVASLNCFADPIQATHAAMAAAQPGDLIVVYGSFWLVGAVMKVGFHLKNEGAPYGKYEKSIG